MTIPSSKRNADYADETDDDENDPPSPRYGGASEIRTLPSPRDQMDDKMTKAATRKPRMTLISQMFFRKGSSIGCRPSDHRLVRRSRPLRRNSCEGWIGEGGSLITRLRSATARQADHSVRAGFTLLELIIVIGIIGVLLVLIAPAFTSLKSAGDVTSAAYTVKGVLDTARTYAKANNTYTWVGFYEEDVSQSSTCPPTAGTGRVVMSIVASKDGTKVYDANSTSIDPTRLIQVGKLAKIQNIHLGLLPLGTGTGDTFDLRPSPTPAPVNDSRFGELNGSPTAPTTNSQYPFQYPVGSPAPTACYTFQKTLQFNPRGESNINSSLGVGGVTYDVKRIVEVGLQATHGTQIDTIRPNLVAVQINGFGGDVRIYRR